MDKFLETNNFSKEDTLDGAINERIKFYKEKNAKFETIFHQCKILTESSSSWHLDIDCDMYKDIDQLGTALEHFGITEFDAPTLAMAYVQKKSNESGYIERLKSMINMFIGLNAEVQKDIDRLSRDLDDAKGEIKGAFDLTNEDVYVIDKKIAAYRNELAKFEKKHSWLKDPRLDLTYIAKEAQILSGMEEEKEALENELKIYEGLEPDLQEASRQVAVIKKKYLEMKDKFHSTV